MSEGLPLSNSVPESAVSIDVVKPQVELSPEERVKRVEDQVAATEREIAAHDADSGRDFAGRLESLAGISLQANGVQVVRKGFSLELDTEERSFQGAFDSFLGELEMQAALVEGGVDLKASSHSQVAGVEFDLGVARSAEERLSYSAKIKLPQGILAWAEHNQDKIKGGLSYAWETEYKAKGVLSLTYNEKGQLVLSGSLLTPEKTKIQFSSVNGQTAQVSVSRTLDLSVGSLRLDASLTGENLLTEARPKEASANLQYNFRF